MENQSIQEFTVRRAAILGTTVILALSLCSVIRLHGAVAFPDPALGWEYIYEGDAAEAGSGGFTALDGEWSHDNGSDEWDGTPIGEGRPGGAMILTEDSVNYLRMQETGDPRDYDMDDPGSNRKLYFGRDITAEGASDTVLDDGVTINFRARVPTAPPLDDSHPDGGGGVEPWPAEGLGYMLHNGGKSTLGVKQATGGNISFSLITAAETGTTDEGLIMNNLNGTSVSGDVDTGEGGTANLLALDPREWHEYWITIEKDPTGTGTHRVTIFVDGAETENEFFVTAGDGSDFGGSYISMGLGATPFQGAVDIDFFAYTLGVKKPGYPEIVNLQPAQGTSFYDATQGLSFEALAGGTATIPVENIQLVLNGQDVSQDLDISGTEQQRTVSYDQLQPGTLYRAEIRVSDQNGKETVLNFAFDTLDPAVGFTIEAEDYNFGPDAVCNIDGSVGGTTSSGGDYLNDPTPSGFVNNVFVNQDQGYVDRVGIPGIDMNDTDTGVVGGADTDLHEYRFCDPVATTATPDFRRQKYEDASTAAGVDIPDYQVEEVQAGEWLNYTRDFEAGNYKVILRAASGVEQMVQLSLVTSDPTQADQTVQPLGDFRLAAGGFSHVALTSVDGSEVIVELSGETTLRLTATEADANLRLNYLMVVPTDDTPTVIGPVVDSAIPAPDATDAEPDLIQVTLRNRETSLDVGSIQLMVDDGDVTASLQVTETTDGAVIEYRPDPVFPPDTQHTVVLTYDDTEGNSFESTWSFTTKPQSPPEIVQQPQHQFVPLGGSATFTVQVTSIDPETYEWQFNGATISGANEASLTIDPVQLSDRGAYTVTIRNDIGEVTSQAAYLVVIQPGWSYTLLTDQLIVGDPSTFSSFDGTWSHDDGSDEWDGSPIGGEFGDDNRPGGVSLIEDYYRIQETGDPRDHGFSDPSSNRKIYLGHDLTSQGGTATILDDGLTLQFRARIPTDGTIDVLHPDGGGATADYPAEGDGYQIHDGGKGNIGIKQASGGIVSFSLITASELNAAAGSNQAGLIMNNLNGTTVSGDVDTGEAGTLNVLPLDPTQWHEFYITIQADASGAGTHQVDIYLDGSTTPQTFIVTAGGGSDFSDITYLAVGTGSTGQSGALDIQNLSFRPGTEPPGPPEILQGPQHQFAEEGDSATFSVIASGGGTLTYEWQLDGTTIDGADQSSLTVDPVSLSDRGAYSVIVRNSLGEVTSQAAYLIVVESGWEYTLRTDQLIVGDPATFSSLDGTWSHDDGSDEWDGSPIGGEFGDGNRPGGVSLIEDYYRIQETGDPRDHGFSDPSSNRKVYLGHDLTSQGGTASILDEGLTLQFQARIPTDGTLDPLHPDGGGATADYPAEGDGYQIHDGGKGNMGIKQANGGIISFSLITASELNAAAGSDQAGLVMNNLNGTSVTGDVDTGEAGTLNVLPLDPTQWHEFYITIQADASGTGTHQVDIYLDGSEDPQTFIVTAGDGSDFSDISYLAIGTGSTGQSGGLDIRNLSFRPGVSAPGGVDPTVPELTIGLNAQGEIQLEWTGTLQTADQVGGPYSDVAGASSPMTVAPAENQKFWRSAR